MARSWSDHRPTAPSHHLYRIAVVATDDWAGAVRAMVNLGRQPLATSIGLTLPNTIDEERVMWSLTTELAADPYTRETISPLNEFCDKVTH